MAETTFRSAITAFVIFFMFLTGMILLINTIEVGSNTGDTSDVVPGFIAGDKLTTFNNTFLSANATKPMRDIQEIQTGLNQVQADAGLVTLALAFVSSSWSSVKLIFTMFSFIPSVIGNVFGLIGNNVLGWVSAFIAVFVAIMVVFGIINLIFGRSD